MTNRWISPESACMGPVRALEPVQADVTFGLKDSGEFENNHERAEARTD